MLRLPLLKSDDAPWGRLQPYLAVGPPLFITNVTPRNTRNFRNHDDDTDLSIGYKLAGGVAFQVYKNLALFGEYRFTHVSPEVELRDANLNRTTLRTDLDTHSALSASPPAGSGPAALDTRPRLTRPRRPAREVLPAAPGRIPYTKGPC